MNFKVDKYEKYALITPHYEKIDSLVSPEIKSKFTALVHEGVRNVMMDMKEVKYIDSSGLSSLLVGYRFFEKNGAFVLYNITEHVMKLIKISKLDEVLSIASSKEEAIDMILLSEIQKGAESHDS